MEITGRRPFELRCFVGLGLQETVLVSGCIRQIRDWKLCVSGGAGQGESNNNQGDGGFLFQNFKTLVGRWFACSRIRGMPHAGMAAVNASHFRQFFQAVV